jgi:hypothetical protein
VRAAFGNKTPNARPCALAAMQNFPDSGLKSQISNFQSALSLPFRVFSVFSGSNQIPSLHHSTTPSSNPVHPVHPVKIIPSPKLFFTASHFRPEIANL